MPASQDEPTAPYMDQANLVGQGFDIFGAYTAGSLITPLFDFNRVPRHNFTFLGKTFSLPTIVNGYEQTSSRYLGGTYVSRESFQNKIAAHAKVEAGYGAFSGQMDASFSMEVAKSSEYYYAFRNFYTQLGYLEVLPDTAALTPNFVQAIEGLPEVFKKEDLSLFADFFTAFGIYYARRVTLGAAFEFYEAVSTSTSDTTADVSLMLEAHYRGLFVTGSVSASITDKTEWKSYIEDSEISMTTTGGNPTLAAKVTGVDAKNPSQATVDAYLGWLESIVTNPAAVEFQLAGIWELAGDKQQAIQEAWREYGLSMHPKLTMETTSPADRPPVATLGRQIKPEHDPRQLAGFQVLILDRRTLTKPEGVVFDRYYTVDPVQWPSEFEEMYNRMADDIRSSGYETEEYILALVSFGIKFNCVLSPDLYGLLRATGAGAQTQYWINNTDPGSSNYDQANSLFAGVFNQGPGTGFELLEHDWNTSPAVASELNLFFYRRREGDRYTMGLAPLTGAEVDDAGEPVVETAVQPPPPPDSGLADHSPT